MKAPIVTVLSITACICGCTLSESANEPGAVSAAATSSASNSPPTVTGRVHFEGNWQGTLTSDLTQTKSTAIALVNGWGEFRLITDGAQFVGWPSRTATNISGTVTGIRNMGSTWNDGSHSSVFEINGAFSEDDSLEATYAGGGESGVFALARINESVSRIESIQGTWVQYDANENIVATIQIGAYDAWQADIRGSHVNGCTYFGNAEAWTSQYSYDVVPFEVSGCPLISGVDVNGAYTGTSALIELAGDAAGETTLVIALNNDLRLQMTFFLHRISG